MDQNTGEFGRKAEGGEERYAPAKPVDLMTDDEFGDWMESLPPPPGFDLTDDELEAELADAEAEIAAGRGYPHAVVVAWMQTWSKPEFKPFHEWLTLSG